ncbi:hypothetical protein [Hasllibacter sp. MH4015]|uniref:hypothetical protein n=1 Tax=Hasllibacter sp. MH4015 TaxID=2854029 RepID=UPI001CD3A8A1|nr:hypothetical protein [Hasllibacter sp. MH4015]
MLRSLIVLSVILSLGACNSNLNPLNWFGGDREQRIQVDPVDGTVIDPRGLVGEITQLSVEQTNSGAIVRATGVTGLQGFYEAELVLVERTPNSLVYDFRAAPPLDNATPGLQEIVAGVSLSFGELAGIRTITVIAQNNRRSVSRR